MIILRGNKQYLTILIYKAIGKTPVLHEYNL